MSTEQLDRIWPEVVRSVCADAASDRPKAMLELVSPTGLVGTTLVLSTGSEATKKYVETNLGTKISEGFAQRMGGPIQLAISVNPALDLASETVIDLTDSQPTVEHRSTFEPVRIPEQTQHTPSPPPIRSHPDQRPIVANGRRGGLNPRYTFETFVRGSANMLAHAAATAVAEQPSISYNPLVIHGSSGLGKTHLLHAIGWYTQQLYPDHVVRYVTSEEFTNEFINSIQHDKGTVFKDRYRKVDLLLVDDIQFLSSKVQTQEEFFHTFNALHQADKQIVVTSDIAPSKINGFEDRLRTRFDWGLLADVQMPDLETRIAIVRKKASLDQVQIPLDVLEFIASNISTNIRELEGALTRVTAFANLNRRPVDLPMVQDVLHDLVSDNARPDITVGLIMSETASYYGLGVEDLQGQSRTRHLSTARQVAIYITRELTELSLPKIGEAFGKRDHTTVMHAERKIRRLMTEDRSIYNQVNEVTMRVRSAARS